MKEKKALIIISAFLITIVIQGCKQIIPTGSGTTVLLHKARKNIYMAESIEDRKRREFLLDSALDQLKRAESDEKKKKEKGKFDGINSGYALYYYTIGDYSRAREYSARALKENSKDPYNMVMDYRIKLKTKGKKYARDAVKELTRIVRANPDMPMAAITLGDAYYYLVEYGKARKYYRKVLLLGREFQISAADRIEILNEIERIKLNPKKYQSLIFSKGVKRGEIASLLHTVFGIQRRFRMKKALPGSFTDLTGVTALVYADSIKELRKRGFFSYIKGKNFEPLKVISRGEMAKIIEDYIVLSSGNIDFRTRYGKSSRSPIKDVESSHIYYNAIRLALQYNIMNLTLSGLMQPDDPMEGLNTLLVIKKMTGRKSYR
jgi:tetratricopeptide (TPR) repeat protein